MSASSTAAASVMAEARPRSVHRALACADGRRLLTDRAFGLGMAISVVTLALASGRLPVGAMDKTETVSFLAGDCFVMLGAAT